VLLNRLFRLLAPGNCLNCGTEGEVICTTCLDEVPFGVRPTCFGCGRSSVNNATCGQCRRTTKLEGVSVGAGYDGVVKELILQLKFHRLRGADEAAAELVLRHLPSGPAILRTDVVTSVPVSAARYRERGYNQAELVGRVVARRLGLPYSPLLGRVNSAHQLGLDRRTRLSQVEGAFFGLRRLSGQQVLIVDDVVTTGATLSECAATLRLAGAGQVWGAAIARH
jgi:competence protein ComFC